jgi:hypothetical protein
MVLGANLRSPAAVAESEPSLLAAELVSYALALMLSRHAWRLGARPRTWWAAALLHHVLAELVFAARGPASERQWHAQAMVMLAGRRVPLFWPLLRASATHIALLAVHRLRLRSVAEPVAVALCATLLLAPPLVLGSRLLWWTWHASDPTLLQRAWGCTPWAALAWHLCAAGVFAGLLRGALLACTCRHRDVAGPAGREMLAVLAAAMCAVPLTEVAFAVCVQLPLQRGSLPAKTCFGALSTGAAFFLWLCERRRLRPTFVAFYTPVVSPSAKSVGSQVPPSPTSNPNNEPWVSVPPSPADAQQQQQEQQLPPLPAPGWSPGPSPTSLRDRRGFAQLQTFSAFDVQVMGHAGAATLQPPRGGGAAAAASAASPAAAAAAAAAAASPSSRSRSGLSPPLSPRPGPSSPHGAAPSAAAAAAAAQWKLGPARWQDDAPFVAVLLVSAAWLAVAAAASPEGVVATGFHQPPGPCSEVAVSRVLLGESVRLSFLCLDAADAVASASALSPDSAPPLPQAELPFDFRCTAEPPAAYQRWYTACGRRVAHGAADQVAGVAALVALGVAVLGHVLRANARVVGVEMTRSPPPPAD